MFSEAEDEAPRIQQLYSAEAAEAISYGTFMKVQLQGKDTANGALSRMLSWLYANVEFSAAALATELSLTRWADDDQFGFAGEHVWLPGASGSASVVQQKCCRGPISYRTFMKGQLQGKETANGTLSRMLSWLYANVEFSAAALATELSDWLGRR